MAAVLVGFVGGASVFELGSIGDMDLFFSCLRSLEGAEFLINSGRYF